MLASGVLFCLSFPYACKRRPLLPVFFQCFQTASSCVPLIASGLQVGDKGGIDEVEKGMEMQEACFGKESPVVAASAKVLGKLRASMTK